MNGSGIGVLCLSFLVNNHHPVQSIFYGELGLLARYSSRIVEREDLNTILDQIYTVILLGCLVFENGENDSLGDG
jgi:hypothetical protein